MSPATTEAPTTPEDTKAARSRDTFTTLLTAHGRLAALTIPFVNWQHLRDLYGEAWKNEGSDGTDAARHYLHETVLSAYEEHLRNVLAAEREAEPPDDLGKAYRSVERRFRLIYAALRAVGEPWDEKYPNVSETLWAAHEALQEGYHDLHRAVKDVASEADDSSGDGAAPVGEEEVVRRVDLGDDGGLHVTRGSDDPAGEIAIRVHMNDPATLTTLRLAPSEALEVVQGLQAALGITPTDEEVCQRLTEIASELRGAGDDAYDYYDRHPMTPNTKYMEELTGRLAALADEVRDVTRWWKEGEAKVDATA